MKNKGIQLSNSITGLESIDLKIEIKRDNNGLITQGLVFGDTMSQNQALILISAPGEFHFNPLIGVSLEDLLFDDDYLLFQNRIIEKFKIDGLIIKELELSEKKPLRIVAVYE